MDYWVHELVLGKPRASVMLSVVNTSEALGRIVTTAYQHYLDVNPTASERTAGITRMKQEGRLHAINASLIGDARFAARAALVPNLT